MLLLFPANYVRLLEVSVSLYLFIVLPLVLLSVGLLFSLFLQKTSGIPIVIELLSE